VPRPTRTAPRLPLDPTAPTLVVAGSGAAVPDVGVPVVAEPTAPGWSGAVRTGPWLLESAELRPAQVVLAGRPTLHRAVQRLLADPAVAVYAVDDPLGWTDVAGTVRAVGSLPELAPDQDWLRRWKVADAAASEALDRALDAPGAPVGLRLARALVAGLPPGAQLVLGSSNPVRDVSLAAVPRPGVRVLANRGVAGIDGTVSTAVGAALAHPGPTVAVLGDLTLLHDTTGLVIGPDEPAPDLAIVVLNDRGGGIFHLLEQGAAEHAAAFERVFGTPHAVDLAALAAAVGVPHLPLGARTDDVTNAITSSRGLRLIELTADRGGLRTAHESLRTAVISAAEGALAHLAG
jgi:2-succinyl-5-enolpyruvyl-6-hydroxy-3-cyclohexene-1-carboxylate synthase